MLPIDCRQGYSRLIRFYLIVDTVYGNKETREPVNPAIEAITVDRTVQREGGPSFPTLYVFVVTPVWRDGSFGEQHKLCGIRNQVAKE